MRVCAGMFRLGNLARRTRLRGSLAMARRQLSDAHPQQDASKNELKKVCVITAGAVLLGLGSVHTLAQTAKDIAKTTGQTAERIADKTGQTAKDIAMISKSGSAEEQAVLDKTEKMAHAAALGSANGASEALKNSWWFLWPFWMSSSTGSWNSAEKSKD